MAGERYDYETKSIDGFLDQLVRYIRRGGHYFYIRCVVPEGKDPRCVAEKLLTRYDIRRKRWQRKRRHLKETASIHLLLYGHVLVIILSKGRHEAFYDDHGNCVRDIRRTALKVFGYSVRFSYCEAEKRDKVSIRLDAGTYRKVKAHMLTIAVWDSYREKPRMEREFSRLPYQVFDPVHAQLVSIARQVNRARRRRGFEQIDLGCIRTRRRLGTVFVERVDESEAA